MTKSRYVRSFSEPDEAVELGPIRSEIIAFGGLTISHDTHQPGWRWSTDMKPAIKTESCQVRHIGMVLKGRLHVVCDDGTEFEAGPLELIDIPAGHDAWVVGDEPFETIGWGGGKTWMAPVTTLGERVLATVLLTDIVESTSIAERMGATAWGELLADFQFRTRDIVGQYRGRVVDFAGDGVLATFDGAARAIRCATALHAMADFLRLSVRSAVHAGEVEVAEDSIRGVTIHEASRMNALAQPGEVIVSETIAVLARDAGVTFDERGEFELRGLQGSRRLFRARR
ncbi:MAG: adenylate/guanylate cyclase domain-containing protein [Steroidobacteraceae bacterium]